MAIIAVIDAMVLVSAITVLEVRLEARFEAGSIKGRLLL